MVRPTLMAMYALDSPKHLRGLIASSLDYLILPSHQLIGAAPALSPWTDYHYYWALACGGRLRRRGFREAYQVPSSMGRARQDDGVTVRDVSAW